MFVDIFVVISNMFDVDMIYMGKCLLFWVYYVKFF